MKYVYQMWYPIDYCPCHHEAIGGLGGHLSFKIVNQLQCGFLSICFHACSNDVILHKGHCISDQSAYALHSLTTFSTYNNFWVLSSLGKAIRELLNFKSGLCTFAVSKMKSLKAGTTLKFLICQCFWARGLFISPKHFCKQHSRSAGLPAAFSS